MGGNAVALGEEVVGRLSAAVKRPRQGLRKRRVGERVEPEFNCQRIGTRAPREG